MKNTDERIVEIIEDYVAEDLTLELLKGKLEALVMCAKLEQLREDNSHP